jgi:predicted enzyme related to lactoylglutathione lyase
MNIHGSMHVIAVPNLATSSAFYRDALGFEVKEMGDPGWRMYVSGQCRIMAGECPDAMRVGETGDHSYFMYLTVDDVVAFHHRAAAAPISRSPFATSLGECANLDFERSMVTAS